MIVTFTNAETVRLVLGAVTREMARQLQEAAVGDVRRVEGRRRAALLSKAVGALTEALGRP